MATCHGRDVGQKSLCLTDISLSKQPLHISLQSNPCPHSTEANSLSSGEPSHTPRGLSLGTALSVFFHLFSVIVQQQFKFMICQPHTLRVYFCTKSCLEICVTEGNRFFLINATKYTVNICNKVLIIVTPPTAQINTVLNHGSCGKMQLSNLFRTQSPTTSFEVDKTVETQTLAWCCPSVNPSVCLRLFWPSPHHAEAPRSLHIAAELLAATQLTVSSICFHSLGQDSLLCSSDTFSRRAAQCNYTMRGG